MNSWENHTAQVRFFRDDDRKYVTENYHDLKKDLSYDDVQELASIVGMYAPKNLVIQSVALTRRDRFSFF